MFILPIFLNGVYHLLPPIGFTYLAIKYLPIIYNWAHALSVTNYIERKRFAETSLEKYEESRTVSITRIAEEKEAQKEQKQKIESAFSTEEKWEIEYNDFKERPLFKKFPQLINSIYQNYGRITWNSARYVDVDILSFAHALGLVKFDDEAKNLISFTEKGNYFNLQFSKNIR